MNPFRCHYCGDVFTTWASAERHADRPGHHRLDLIATARTQGGP